MTVEYKNTLSKIKAFVISPYHFIKTFERLRTPFIEKLNWDSAPRYLSPKLWKADAKKNEIKALKARIAALQLAQVEAGKNALDLYAENESLRRYRDLCVHGPGSFVTGDDHKALRRKLEDTEKKLAAVSKVNSDMQEAWNNYMVAHD